MITMNLEITGRELTTQQEEQLRTALRKAALSFIFDTAEKAGFDDTKIAVSGDIKTSSIVM